jgi:hypothetical protein
VDLNKSIRLTTLLGSNPEGNSNIPTTYRIPTK